MNFTPYIPTVTWHMCAEFEAFTISSIKSVLAVLAFGQVVVTALYPNSLTEWVAI